MFPWKNFLITRASGYFAAVRRSDDLITTPQFSIQANKQNSNICAGHLEEGNPFALVEDEVLVHEGRLRGHALVAGAHLVL